MKEVIGLYTSRIIMGKEASWIAVADGLDILNRTAGVEQSRREKKGESVIRRRPHHLTCIYRLARVIASCAKSDSCTALFHLQVLSRPRL